MYVGTEAGQLSLYMYIRIPITLCPAHGEAGLELTPTKRLTGKLAPPPKVGALDWEKDIQEKEKDLFEAVMYRLREQVTQRRILAKPCFQDFDKSVLTIRPFQSKIVYFYKGIYFKLCI